MLKKIIKPVSLLLVFAFLLLDFSVHTATAKMIDTNTVIAVQKDQASRERVAAFLGREDVQQVMVRHGVDVTEAQKRVASLSDAELLRISQTMDQLPAGGGAVGTIVGAALLIFLVLLVTDLLGLTHVYPFVTHRR